MQTNRISGTKCLAALGLCALCVLAVTGLTRMLTPGDPEAPAPKPATEMPPRLFQGWPKPELALVLSAEQHGYLLPCGCSRPQVGGLERRYNFLKLLRAKDWPVAAVDLGDIPQTEGPRKLPNVQGLIKYRYSMDSLNKMGYLAVGLGKFDAALSLFPLLGEFALNDRTRTPTVVAANLHDKENQYPEQVFDYTVKPIAGSSLKVGVAGLIAPSVGKEIKAFKVELDDNRKVIPKLLADLKKEKADLFVLIYQGTLQEAKSLAANHKEFHVILCLANEDEPSSEPARVGDTLIVSTGHKGRYIGVAGVYATGKPEKPFAFRYQLVSLSEEFLTPAEEQAKQPILTLMEQYTKELKDQNYLTKYGQMKHPSQVAVPGVVPTYVGSDVKPHDCQKCHESAYIVWKNSKHSHAYETLVKAKQPSLRQFDAECIVCHTVGFGYETGYKTEKDTPHLKNVGCESCHGPASEHVKKPNDAAWYPILNPWRPPQNETAEQKKQRMLRIDRVCQECHDVDNDVKYKFEKRWPEIAHPSPGNEDR